MESPSRLTATETSHSSASAPVELTVSCAQWKLSKTEQTPGASNSYSLTMDNGDILKTKEQVPRSGIYRVSHTHPIRDIRLLRGKIFPACPKCSSAMQFALISAIPVESAAGRFRFLMQGTSPRIV